MTLKRLGKLFLNAQALSLRTQIRPCGRIHICMKEPEIYFNAKNYISMRKHDLSLQKQETRKSEIYIKKQLKYRKPLPIPICLPDMYSKIER